MKKSTFFLTIVLFSFLYFNSNIFSQGFIDEYGSTNTNRYLSGLGIAASYVNVPNQTYFDQNENGSLEMWVYPTSYTGTDKTLISKGATTNVSFLWGLTSGTGLMYFRIGSTNFANTGGTAPPLNQWSHVVVTWTGGPNFTVRFYLNGTPSGTALSTFANWNINTDPIRIGGSQAFPGNAFIGNLDEVRYRSVELAESRIITDRFIGLGDGTSANSGGALTTNSYYSGLISSWTFNKTNIPYDDISGYNGTYLGSANSTAQTLSMPMPYNFALKLGDAASDHIVIPNNSVFNQTTDGTLELWFRPLTFINEQILISKGSAPAAISFILGVSANTGKLYFGSGPSIAQNTSGSALVLNQWNHIAVTWAISGGNFEVKFYRNGRLNGSPSTITASFPVNTSSVWIGGSQVYNLPARGWIDEVRLWSPAMSEQEIDNYMFVSCRAITNSNLLGAWNFDGNLLNFSATAGLNGSFNTGSNNKCRFSGYVNDDSPGLPVQNLTSHSTTINRGGSPNPFPNGFLIRNVNSIIPDFNYTGISDSVTIYNPVVSVTSIEVFVSIEHSYVSDLNLTLRAPNGQERYIIRHNGGSSDNLISFFSDDFINTLTTPNYYPPWGFVKPLAVFSNFGGASVNGTWRLKCADSVAGDIGILRAWGLRFNNVTGTKTVSNSVPVRFALYQNYPNPFNPVTTIKYDIPKDEFVRITLFDILGREVVNLTNEYKKAGSYEVRLDASSLSSGTYFYRFDAGGFTDSKKMIILK